MKRDYARLARLQPTLRLCCFHLRYNHMGSKKKSLSKDIYRREQRFPGHMPWAWLLCRDLSQEIITSCLSSILSRAKEGSILQCIYWILCWRLFLTGLFKFSCGENHLFIMTLMISDKTAMLRNKTRSFDYVLYYIGFKFSFLFTN